MARTEAKHAVFACWLNHFSKGFQRTVDIRFPWWWWWIPESQGHSVKLNLLPLSFSKPWVFQIKLKMSSSKKIKNKKDHTCIKNRSDKIVSLPFLDIADCPAYNKSAYHSFPWIWHASEVFILKNCGQDLNFVFASAAKTMGGQFIIDEFGISAAVSN